MGPLFPVLLFLLDRVAVLGDLGLERRELQLELVDAPCVSFAGAVTLLGFV
jgi:hypothetical protein